MGGTEGGGIKIPGWRGLVPGVDTKETTESNPDGSVKTTQTQAVNSAAGTFGRTLGLSGGLAAVGAGAEFGANALARGAGKLGQKIFKSETEYEADMQMLLAQHYQYRGDLSAIREQNTTGAIRNAFR